jgi:proteasome accessory factor C
MALGRLSAPERVRRMLAIVPWIAAQPGGASIEEVCRRFAIPRDRLVSDLSTLQFVGVAPFSPDRLVEVAMDGDHVEIHLPQAFDRPLRLTPDEAVALVAAGKSLLAIPGADPDGPLARALDKAAAMLGVEGRTGLEVSLGRVDDEILAELRAAVSAHRRVRLDYYSYGRDEHTERVVDPLRLWSDGGAWYLAGWCHLAQDDRVFRVDRVHRLERLDEPFEPPAEPPRPPVFSPADDDERVVLDLEPEARWVVEYYPADSVTDLGDGRTRVVLAVGAPQWLARLLLRLGPDATVVDGPEELRQVGSAAASRVLARYRR